MPGAWAFESRSRYVHAQHAYAFGVHGFMGLRKVEQTDVARTHDDGQRGSNAQLELPVQRSHQHIARFRIACTLGAHGAREPPRSTR